MDEHNEFKVKNYQIRRDDNTKGRNKYVTNSDFQEVRIHFQGSVLFRKQEKVLYSGGSYQQLQRKVFWTHETYDKLV